MMLEKALPRTRFISCMGQLLLVVLRSARGIIKVTDCPISESASGGQPVEV